MDGWTPFDALDGHVLNPHISMCQAQTQQGTPRAHNNNQQKERRTARSTPRRLEMERKCSCPVDRHVRS